MGSTEFSNSKAMRKENNSRHHAVMANSVGWVYLDQRLFRLWQFQRLIGSLGNNRVVSRGVGRIVQPVKETAVFTGQLRERQLWVKKGGSSEEKDGEEELLKTLAQQRSY